MKIFNKNITILYFALSFFLVLLVPYIVGAQSKTLVSDKLFKNDDLSAYFNSLFNLALTIGAILAVIIIATAGIQYMTTDAFTGKTRGKERIQQAVLGLLMLLAVYLFFRTIDPDILKLNFSLKPVNVAISTNDSNLGNQNNQTERANRNPIIPGSNIGTSYVNPSWTSFPPSGNCTDTRGGGWVGIDSHHCAGVAPSAASRCCGLDPNYSPPETQTDASAGKWCSWEGGTSTCGAATTVTPGSWCYEIIGSGQNCYPTETLCNADNDIDDNGISSCNPLRFKVGDSLSVYDPADVELDLEAGVNHGRSGVINEVRVNALGNTIYSVTFSDGTKHSGSEKAFRQTN